MARIKAQRKRSATAKTIVILITAALLIALFYYSSVSGMLQVSFGELMRGLFIEGNDLVDIIWDTRLPRIMISMLVGCALAISGVLLQSVLRNPLADPGIIGISGGAKFIEVAVMGFFPGLFMIAPLFSFLGGMLAFGLVYTLSWRQGISPTRIILVGVAISAMFMGLTEGLGYFTGRALGPQMPQGSLNFKTWADVQILLYYIPVCVIAAILMTRICNLLVLEEKTAKGLGINTDRMRFIISVIAVMLASISTAVVGVVSFLALIVPHIARTLVGHDHRWLVPYSGLLGAFIFLLFDTIGRTVVQPAEIPPIILMSVIGGPMFIILLKRGDRKRA
ncbi:MAG: iron ABC transporter permease [Eubacteriales bacterium]|nr:iron ABC transporter permease [Eubacteriales bacterium]